MKSHPYADLFPMMSEEEIKELSKDIEKRGLIDQIITYNGVILDGRNRYAALCIAGLEQNPAWYKEYDCGDDIIGFVASKNLTRRHLTPGQRAGIAAGIANISLGDNQHGGSLNSDTQISLEQAAKIMNVSRDSVAKARAVQRADPEFAAKVRDGSVTLNAAHVKVKTAAEKPPEKAPVWKIIQFDIGGIFYPKWSLDAANTSSTARDKVEHAWKSTRAEFLRATGHEMPDMVFRGSDDAKAATAAYKAAYLIDNPEKAPEIAEIRTEVPESMQAKFDRLIKQAEASLRATIEAEIRKRVEDRVGEIRDRMHQKEMELTSFERRLQARAQREGFMKTEEFKLILGCLHPDRESPPDRKSKAFDLFNKMQFGVSGMTKQ
jgi:hypothetical protein